MTVGELLEQLQVVDKNKKIYIPEHFFETAGDYTSDFTVQIDDEMIILEPLN